VENHIKQYGYIIFPMTLKWNQTQSHTGNTSCSNLTKCWKSRQKKRTLIYYHGITYAHNTSLLTPTCFGYCHIIHRENLQSAHRNHWTRLAPLFNLCLYIPGSDMVLTVPMYLTQVLCITSALLFKTLILQLLRWKQYSKHTVDNKTATVIHNGIEAHTVYWVSTNTSRSS
jgi:hypothetical protein